MLFDSFFNQRIIDNGLGIHEAEYVVNPYLFVSIITL